MSVSPWSYTRNQRAGLILLLLILTGAYLLTRWLGTEPPSSWPPDDEALFAAAEHLRSAETTAPEATPESFPFDPNSATHPELLRLGLSDRQATAFLRYRDKRPFRSVEDIGRLRVLRPEQASHLQGLARLEEAGSRATIRTTPSPPPAERFFFDPNTLPADSLRMLGFTDQEARALVRYRSYRPLTFRRPEDMRRVHALDSARLDSVLGLVRIALPPDPAPAATARDTTSRNDAPLRPIDINRADVAEWSALPGIGPYRAGRIVEYRERLGGFATPEQVGTVYGLPDSVFRRIRPYLLGSPVTRPLYINRLGAEELARHPLLKRSTATVIVRYRENHGPFQSADDLKKVRALSTETLTELLPYLKFDP